MIHLSCRIHYLQCDGQYVLAIMPGHMWLPTKQAGTTTFDPDLIADAFLAMGRLASLCLFSTISYPTLSAFFILSATGWCLISRSLIPLGFPVSCVILSYLSLILSSP